MSLSSAPIAEWLLAEKASGAIDSPILDAENDNHLTTYNTFDLSYLVLTAGRGIQNGGISPQQSSGYAALDGLNTNGSVGQAIAGQNKFSLVVSVKQKTWHHWRSPSFWIGDTAAGNNAAFSVGLGYQFSTTNAGVDVCISGDNPSTDQHYSVHPVTENTTDTRVFHIVVDLTQASEADRIRVYVNGVYAGAKIYGDVPVKDYTASNTLNSTWSVQLLGRPDTGSHPHADYGYFALLDYPLTQQEVTDSYDELVLDTDTQLTVSSGPAPVTVTAETASLGLNSTEPAVSHVPAAQTTTPETATLGLNSTQPVVSQVAAGATVTAEDGSFGLNSTQPVVSHVPAAQTTTPETATLGLNSTQPVVSHVAAGASVTSETAIFGLNADEPVVSHIDNITLTAADASFGITADTVVMLRYDIADLTFGMTATTPVVTNVAAPAIIVTAETGNFGLNSTEPAVSHVPSAVSVTAETGTLALSSTEPAVSHIPAAVSVTSETANFGLNSTEPAVTIETATFSIVDVDGVIEANNPTVYDNQTSVEINCLNAGAVEGIVEYGGIAQPIDTWTPTKITITAIDSGALTLGDYTMRVLKPI